MYEYMSCITEVGNAQLPINPTIHIKNKHNWTQQQMRLEQTSTLQ